MKKLIILPSIILTALLLVAIIFSTGCTWLFSPSCVDFPAIASDSSGGAIAIYEVLKSDDARDLYAQRISPEGDSLWGERGMLIDSGYESGCSLFNLHIVYDGSSGAIIAWGTYPSKPDWNLPPGERKVQRVTTITRVDSQGNILWQKEVDRVGHMISDGSSGAIIAWREEYSGSLYLQRIGPQGGLLWHEDNTVLLETCRRLHDLTSNTLGNAFIAWDDGEGNLFTQKVDSSGELLWGQSGLLVCGAFSSEPKMIADNSGGAVLAWIYEKQGEPGGSNISSPIYSQKISPEGNILWQPEGMPVSIGSQTMLGQPRLVSDDSGGAIVFWESRVSIYAQRLSATGNALWPEGGIQVWDGEGTPRSPYYSVASDGSGGAITVWNYVEKGKRGGESATLRGQRLAADGKKLWGDDGIMVSTGIKDRGATRVVISHDGLGCALIAWGVGKSTYRPDKSYVQRIDAEGNRLWGEEGIRLDR